MRGAVQKRRLSFFGGTMGKFRLLMCVALLATVSACGNDDIETPPLSQNPIENLTQREDVLLNVESAYNARRIDWYSAVLDPNFTFFLSPGDVNGGLPASWDRAEEIAVNMRLFDKNYTDLPCQSISMDIRTEDGISWIEITPESAPAEKWYQVALFYEFKFEIAPNTYISATGAKAVFTVRDAGPYGEYDHHWQLVEFRDLGDDALASLSSSQSQAQSAQ